MPKQHYGQVFPLNNKGNISLWKKVSQKVNLGRRLSPDTRPPLWHRYFKGQNFSVKNLSKNSK